MDGEKDKIVGILKKFNLRDNIKREDGHLVINFRKEDLTEEEFEEFRKFLEENKISIEHINESGYNRQIRVRNFLDM